MRLLSWIKRIFYLAMAVLFLISFSSPCMAASTQDQRVVRVGFYEYPYFQEIAKNGSLSGYSYDYLQAIAQYTGWRYEYVTTHTYAECLTLLEKGEIDLMGVVTKTPEREKVFDFPDLSSSINLSLLVTGAENTDFAFEDYPSFDGITVGLQKSSARNDRLLRFAEQKGFSIKTITYDTKEALQNALKNGTVDAILISTNQKAPDYRVIASFDANRSYYVTTKGNTALLNELNDSLKKLSEKHPYLQENLCKKYYDFSQGQTPVFSREELAYIKANPTLNVVYDCAWGPYESTAKNGEPLGISIDLMERISEITGIDFCYIPSPCQDSAIRLMNNGEGDLLTALSYNYHRAYLHNVYITQPYLSVEYVTAYRLERTENRRLALPKGYQISSIIMDREPETSKIIYYNSVSECLDAVYEGEADYTFLSSYEMEYYLNIPKYHAINYRSLQVSPLELSIGVSKAQDPILFSIIEKSLSGIAGADIQQIIQTHITHSKEDSMLNLLYGNPVEFVVIMCIIFAALLIAMVAFTLYRSNSQKNIQLQQENEAKSHFLSRVSHDMRTPMNGILGITYLAKQRTTVRDLQEDMEQIELSGKMLLNLINDTLDISRIESGKLTLHPTVCNEEKIFETVLRIVKPSMQEKNIQFSFHKKNIQWLSIYTDAQRLQQIFLNLLTNAIKFTPAGGTISLSMECLWEREDAVFDRFIVKDTGIGMSKEFQEHLFDAFAQENKINTDNTVGTGLGLSIVKSIVDLMGGSIEVMSEENVGTEVSITLELPVAQREKEGNPSLFTDYSILNKKRVLLCEDHDLNAKIATKLLERVGMLVERAENGKLALALFEHSAPGYYDAILMDIRMPIMGGYEATAKLRALHREDAKHIPIIALSANAFSEDIEKSKSVGMDGHLSKPIDPDTLYESLSALLSERKG